MSCHEYFVPYRTAHVCSLMTTRVHSFSFSPSSLPPLAPLPSPFFRLFPPTLPPSLKQHQAEWHKEGEERLAFLTDPSVPPGHTAMSMEEKKTLDVLRERKYISAVFSLGLIWRVLEVLILLLYQEAEIFILITCLFILHTQSTHV